MRGDVLAEIPETVRSGQRPVFPIVGLVDDKQREVTLYAAMSREPVDSVELAIDGFERVLAVAIKRLRYGAAIVEQRVHDLTIIPSERLQDGEKLVFGEGEELVLLFRDLGKGVRIARPVRRAFEQAVAVFIIETHAPKTKQDAEKKAPLQLVIEKFVAAEESHAGDDDLRLPPRFA